MQRQERRPYWRQEKEERPGRGEPQPWEDEGEIESFQDRHRSFSDRVERLLIQLVVLGLVGMVLLQALQMDRLTRVIAAEGVPVSEVRSWARSAPEPSVRAVSGAATTMRIKVMAVSSRAVPGARLLVNGQDRGDFGGGSITAQVQPGDVLIIDCTGVAGEHTFRVVESTGVDQPALGASITLRGNRQRLGVVRGP